MTATKTRLVLSLFAATGILLSVVLPSGSGSTRPRPVLSGFVGAVAAPFREPAAPVVVRPARPVSVTVRPGDTLASIGAGLGVSWEALAGWNRLADPNVIVAGLVLAVPPPGYAPPPRPPVLVAARPSAPKAPVAHVQVAPPPAGSCAAADHGRGVYGLQALEVLWVSCGGPSWAASWAASIAQCESGGESWAYNRSGASGLWQILGGTGNLFDPADNALNAVAKFRGRGDTFAAWVCQ